MEAWQVFFAAQVGASAALAGLLFVGVSLNLSEIIASTRLTDRAMQALIVLVGILIIASIMIIPGQSNTAVGLEILILGLCFWFGVTRIDLRILSKTEDQYRGQFMQNMVLTQIALLPYPIAGAAVLIAGANGLYLLPLAMLFSFVKAILDSWMLLIEIKR